MAFKSTFTYIDYVLSINKCYFHYYVGSIYPNELEIKDIAKSALSVLYSDIFLEKGINCNLTIKLYDKRDDFQFFYHQPSLLMHLCIFITCIWSFGLSVNSIRRSIFYVWIDSKTRQTTDKQVDKVR